MAVILNDENNNNNKTAECIMLHKRKIRNLNKSFNMIYRNNEKKKTYI